jgi:hypothetical protein
VSGRIHRKAELIVEQQWQIRRRFSGHHNLAKSDLAKFWRPWFIVGPGTPAINCRQLDCGLTIICIAHN